MRAQSCLGTKSQVKDTKVMLPKSLYLDVEEIPTVGWIVIQVGSVNCELEGAPS